MIHTSRSCNSTASLRVSKQKCVLGLLRGGMGGRGLGVPSHPTSCIRPRPGREACGTPLWRGVPQPRRGHVKLGTMSKYDEGGIPISVRRKRSAAGKGTHTLSAEGWVCHSPTARRAAESGGRNTSCPDFAAQQRRGTRSSRCLVGENINKQQEMPSPWVYFCIASFINTGEIYRGFWPPE